MPGLSQWGNRWLNRGYRLLTPGKTPCPACWKHISLPEDLSDAGLNTVIQCPSCGWRGTIDAIALSESEVPQALEEKPEKSKIVESREEEGRISWWMPASHRFNWALAVALVWLLLVGSFTAMWVFSDSSAKPEGSAWIGPVIIGLFWVPGLALMAGGLWMALASQRIIVARGGPLINERNFLGMKFRGVLELKPGTQVLWVAAYEQNDRPVYTVEINSGKKERVRLNSQLGKREMRWMFGRLSEELGPPEGTVQEAVGAGFSSDTLEERDFKHLSIHRLETGGCEMVFSYQGWLLATLVGFGMLVAAIFLAWDTLGGTGGDYEGAERWIKVPFVVIPGFLAVVFGVLGLGLLGVAFWLRGRLRTIEFFDDRLVVTTTRRGRQSSETWLKETFEEVRIAPTGRMNEQARFSAKLLGATRAVTLCRFRSAEEVGLIKAWAGAWLSQSDSKG